MWQYYYGMRLRGFSPGCQPMNGLIERIDDPNKEYHDILVYDRKLSRIECEDYELDFLIAMNMVDADGKETR